MKSSKTILPFALILVFTAIAFSQEPTPTPTPAFRPDGCPVMPVGFGCLTQAEMNAAAKAVREAEALKIELDGYKQALLDKDKIIENIKTTAAANEADLRESLHKTEIELAEKTGHIIGVEAQNVQQRAIIEVLLKSTKKRCLLAICF